MGNPSESSKATHSLQNDLGLHFGKSRRCTFRFYQRKHNAVVKVIQGESKTFSFYYHYTFYSFFSIAHSSLVWFLSRVWQRKSICDLRILGSFFSGAWWHKMFTRSFLWTCPPLFPTFCQTPPRAGFRWCHHQSMEGTLSM